MSGVLDWYTLDASDQLRLGPDEVLVKPNASSSSSGFKAGETLQQ